MVIEKEEVKFQTMIYSTKELFISKKLMEKVVYKLDIKRAIKDRLKMAKNKGREFNAIRERYL